MRGDPLDDWRVRMRGEGYAEATIRARISAVRSASQWLEIEPHDLDEAGVVAWLGARDRAAWTRLKYLAHIQAWAKYAGIPDPTTGIRRPRQPIGVPRPVAEADLAAMLAAARSGRERCWTLLGAYAGLRAHESAKVEAEDLEPGPDAWLLRVFGKGGQLAVVPLAPVVLEDLREAIAAVGGSGRLWPGATAAAVEHTIYRVARRAGVSCSSHQLRHRYGTACYAESRDLLLTQELMRHRSPSTTAGYARVAGGAGARLVAALPGATGSSERPYLRLVR